MNRLQWKLFTFFMIAMFPLLALGDRHPWAAVAGLSCIPLLLLSTFGWMIIRAIRDAVLRGRGVRTVGIVIHARSSGYTNHIPTWEIDVQLPDGNVATVLVDRTLPFTYREPFTVIVDPRHPTRAALPSTPSHDF